MNQPSPYFIRRNAPPEPETIEIRDFSVVAEPIHPLRDYWLTIQRHRWLILSSAFAILVCAALYTFVQTPLYTAETSILIERKAPQILKLQDTKGDSTDDYNQEFYKTQYEILKSRALAERIVRDEGFQNNPILFKADSGKGKKDGLVAGLWNDAKRWVKSFFPSQPDAGAPNAAAANVALIGTYLGRLEVRPISGTSIVQIRFTTPDPALSAYLANTHAAAYVRYGVDLRSQTNEDATDFLKQRLTELKERVEQSEAALNSYRRDKGIISIDEKSNIVIERLSDLNKSLTVAEGERISLEAQIRTIRGRNYDELTGALNSGVITNLKGELGKLETEYAGMTNYKPGYPSVDRDNLKARIAELRRNLRAEIQNDVKAVEAAYTAAKNKEDGLRARMEQQKKDTLNLKDSAVQYGILAREVDTNRQLYDAVLQRLKEIAVAAENRSSNIHQMGKAQPPLSPSYPNKQRMLLLGLLLGLSGGIGLAFLLEQLDNTFKSPEEAERYMGLPSLAVMPDFRRLNGNGNGYGSRLASSVKSESPASADGRSSRHVVLKHHPLSQVTETYRALRSSLMLSLAGGPPQIMLLTSAVSSEGKTTTVVNAALVFAQLGIRVLVIDADLRRPTCHMLLQLENRAGLAEVLTGQIEWRDAIRPTSAENLSLMTSGALPPNPAELLGSKKMHEMLEQLREHYEFVFIDSSPVMAVSDAVFLSTMADGTLLVVNGKTPRPIVRKVRARLNTPHTKILGILLNQIDMRTGEYKTYYKYYDDYYHHGPEPPTDKTGIFSNGNGVEAEAGADKGRPHKGADF